ncbi:unnamed protein product [Citrullus colocynthis]|uniref:Uncharacterized protein n=1 Tax=Citrullus colocynthis TaxID=252529 RepID=A0ABP0YG75_9ROSI
MEKPAAAPILCFLLLSAAAVAVSADAADCIDGCFTACVQKDTRLMQRCEGKCRIKCGPDNEVDENLTR